LQPTLHIHNTTSTTEAGLLVNKTHYQSVTYTKL